jgi:hypothetical protein
MRALLVAEGQHELGGALRRIVERLTSRFSEIEQAKVSSPTIHVHRGKGQGYFKRAIRWMLEAEKHGYDALILVIDHDNVPERISELTEAQQHTGTTSIRRAVGVAVRTFDAWMLADETALTATLGLPVNCQPSPEDIAQPKATCEKLLAASDLTSSRTDFYSAVAATLDIEMLEKRCPKGFAPFAQRVRAL